MNRPTILVSEILVPSLLERLQARFPQVDFLPVPREGELPAGVERATGFFRSAMTQELFEELLVRAPDLRWVHITAAGFDWLMSDNVRRRLEDGSLTLTRSANSYNVSIGEYVIGAMFLLAKGFPAAIAAQERREWTNPSAREIGGSTVGIIGAGAIGGEIAWRARALGAKVTGIRRTPEPMEHFDQVLGTDALDQVLAESDWVVLAMPLTDETRYMITERELRLMKKDAYLINIGRGALTREEDLVTALNEEWIAGAVIDVFEVEPLPEDHPLWGAKNAVLTPHSSFRAENNHLRLFEEFCSNLERFLAGEAPINTMRQPELGY